MRVVVVRILLGVGIFAGSLLGASLLVDWLGAGDAKVEMPPGDRDGLDRVPVVEPVAAGDDPAAAGDGLSPVSGTGYTGAGGGPSPPTPGGGGGGSEPSVALGPDDPAGADGEVHDGEAVGRHFEDPCAGSAPGEPPPDEAGCGEGEPGTILAILEPPAAEVAVITAPWTDPRARRCAGMPEDEGEPAIAVSTTTPGDWTLEWWPEDTPDDRRRVELSSSDPAHPEHRQYLDWFESWDGAARPWETYVQHCVVIDGIVRGPTGGPRTFLLSAEGTDIYGRSAVGAARLQLSDSRGRPPVRVQPLDATFVRVSVPHRNDQQALARAVALEEDEEGPAACERVEALRLGSSEFETAFEPESTTTSERHPRGMIESGWTLPRDTISDPEYPYDPAYREVYEAGLAVDEGSRYALCVWWSRSPTASFERGEVEEREVRLLAAPDVPRVRFRLLELDLERSVNPDTFDLHFALVPAGGGGSLCGAYLPEGGPTLRGGSASRLTPPELICDSGADTGAFPDTVDLVAHHRSGGRATVRIPLGLCGLPAAPSGAPQVGVEGATVRVGCKGPGTTELFRVVIPASRDDTVCGESVFSSCEFDRVGTALIQVEYYDEGTAGGSDFAVGDAEEYEVEPGPPEPLPPEPRFDTWSTTTRATSPGVLEVVYRVDRPVTGEVRATPRSREDCPAPTTPLPEGVDRGMVTVTGLCSLEFYDLAIDVVDADGNRATLVRQALTTGTPVNMGVVVRVDAVSSDWHNSFFLHGVGVAFRHENYPIATRFDLPHPRCAATGQTYDGFGSGPADDPVRLQMSIRLSRLDERAGVGCLGTPPIEVDHAEQVPLDDLLAGPKVVVLEEGGIRVTVTITTGRP